LGFFGNTESDTKSDPYVRTVRVPGTYVPPRRNPGNGKKMAPK
jgi:hypothetical protein